MRTFCILQNCNRLISHLKYSKNLEKIDLFFVILLRFLILNLSNLYSCPSIRPAINATINSTPASFCTLPFSILCLSSNKQRTEILIFAFEFCEIHLLRLWNQIQIVCVFCFLAKNLENVLLSLCICNINKI